MSNYSEMMVWQEGKLEKIGERWAGKIFGTNTGELFVRLSQAADNKITGDLRLMDSRFGLSVFSVSGTFSDGVLQLKGTPTEFAEGVVVDEIDAKLELLSNGSFRGDWSSGTGTAGTVELFPHDWSTAESVSKTEVATPNQLFTNTRNVGAVRIFADDLAELLEVVSADFKSGRVVAMYYHRGNRVTRYADNLEEMLQAVGTVRYLKLVIQEPEAQGINRLVEVELDASSSNRILVQGPGESWVIGKAESIAKQLKRYESSYATQVGKYGVGLGQLMILATIVFAPEIDDWGYRLAGVAAVFVLLYLFFSLHSRFIPTVSISMAERDPGFLKRRWPGIVSWIAGIAAAVAAGLILDFVARESKQPEPVVVSAPVTSEESQD